MLVNNNELTVYRGEEFTIHKELVNRDGTPYVVSSELSNPCWLISITNSLYSQPGRIVRNYWLPLMIDTFPYNNLFNIKDIKTTATGDVQKYPSFDFIDKFPLVGYYKGYLVSIPYDYGVFECDGQYRVYTENSKDSWKEYRCQIVKTFTSSDTRTWSPKNYVYTIQLLSGQTTKEYLVERCEDLSIDAIGDVDTLYNRLLNSGAAFPEDFDVNAYLYRIQSSYPILAPTKLKVTDYAQGDLL